MKTLGRVLTAMITPFLDNGDVDFDGAVKLGNYLLDNGSDGLVICGTTGESPTISKKDKIKLFEVISESCGNKGSIIANIGSNNTQDSVQFAKEISHIKLDAIMAVVPYYNKPNQEGCYQHFKAIATATDFPIIVYNVPGRTSSKILPPTISRLASEFKNIVALKDATGDLNEASEAVRVCPKGFMVYSGEDSLTLPILSVGGCGVISVISHVAGVKLNEMIKAFENNDSSKALELHHELSPLAKGMFITTNPIPVKTAMRLMSLPAGPFRLPLVNATKSEEMFIKNLITPYISTK